MLDMAESEIRRFITDRFCYGDAAVALGSHDSLIGRGIVDSTGIIEIVTFLQDAYGIRVEDEEIVPGNLDSIARLSRYVQQKAGEPARGA
ncbi:MAG: acyl carrier protein [Acidobacteria bacterium]|jgi:acyl carrier protein|nr:acyl carrier protein [Acidobacteriota bacterium]